MSAEVYREEGFFSENATETANCLYKEILEIVDFCQEILSKKNEKNTQQIGNYCLLCLEEIRSILCRMEEDYDFASLKEIWKEIGWIRRVLLMMKLEKIAKETEMEEVSKKAEELVRYIKAISDRRKRYHAPLFTDDIPLISFWGKVKSLIFKRK